MSTKTIYSNSNSRAATQSSRTATLKLKNRAPPQQAKEKVRKTKVMVEYEEYEKLEKEIKETQDLLKDVCTSRVKDMYKIIDLNKKLERMQKKLDEYDIKVYHPQQEKVKFNSDDIFNVMKEVENNQYYRK